MSQADVRRTLRAVALVIAVLAAIDPAFPVVDAVSRPVVVVTASTVDAAAARHAVEEVAADRVLVTREAANGRLPCASDEDCVVIADGSVDIDWDLRLRPMAIIKMPIAGAPNVAVRSVSVSRGHRGAAGTARIALAGRGMQGQRTEVRVLDGEAVLGANTHAWSAAGTAVVDVPWWPLAAGARALRIEAVPIEGEATAADNRMDIGVSIETATVPVMIFDARPSWHSTFIRRALEDDARFAVRHRSRVAPSLSTGTVNGRLDTETLDQVPLVIAGGIDALGASDVSLLETYVTRRGGTLVLLPERAPSGEVRRLFTGNWTERLAPVPEAVGVLRAGEMLRMTSAPPAATVLAASGNAAVIVSNPTGAGRIIIAGAMDSWRYRHLDAGPPAASQVGGFDRFWRSLAAEGAAAGEGLAISFAGAVMERGARVGFTLRDRHMDAAASSEPSVVQRCGDGPAQPLRVWPRGAIGEFSGEVVALAIGTCTVEATVGDRQVSASVAIVDHASRAVDDTLAKLERRVRASGGVVVNAGDEQAIRSVLRDGNAASRDVTAYPMRSAWWMLPFAVCLSIEWWLRRRNGLR